MNDPKVIVALDFADAAAALAFAGRVSPNQCRLKVGKELFTTAGPHLVEALVAKGFDVFLDLKFHDIPHTVAQACKAAARLGVWMVNVHASGGRKMMETTRDALEALPQRPLLIAVTVLTSMDEAQLAELGLPEPAAQVERLARLTRDCGLDGVVCSAQEASLLRGVCGPEFKLVTPGIRPADASVDDQHRIMTPDAAIRAGSDYLVIGRPITQSADPVATLDRINQSLELL
ncbi:orotidine-5'-phosphate decarboxylase [Jeongeupia naejangsanensis]|uniref:Orotidine 5'-phosphate decarboxylase n=1 Tax=Jeongeupia naejangsanensis TaxID=613195 RepID=A0ABS2BFJ8_9NEIS|nr:orotidine-5'-phosphate decarboxylase [Jeongeupia naejangsanensis]MBM3114230.1 orotidine-5'-phosphate decarboxylase [Jeongeupia naejangsanensis]